MKKIMIIAFIYMSIFGFQNFLQIGKVQAQEIQQESIGLGDVIFTEKASEETHSILSNELSYNIIKLHLVIAGKNIETDNYQSETLTTIKKLEELTKTDVIELLTVSTNKQEALAIYLAECDQNLQKGDSISAYMKQEMEIFKQDMQSCINEKNITDKAYFDAIDRYDQKIMETSLTDSIAYETCATENRIQYNAKIGIAQKIVFYLGVLQKKYDILFAKQDIVTKNFEIFRDNILPDLNEIDQIIKQYTF